MKTKLIFLYTCVFNSFMLCAQFPVHVKEIKCVANQVVSVSGNLNQGAKMENLSWAWNSSIACFPATQRQKFTGNHVLYYTVLPPKAIMNITLVPNDKTANFSLYAYQIGTTNYSTVPDLSSCVTCEADYKWDYVKVDKTQDHRRMVEVNSIDNPYNIVIGVVGADGLSEGEYTLSIQITGGEQNEMEKQEEVKLIPVQTSKNQTTTINGDLKNGVVIQDLSWAWKSSVACFPATQASKFRGNHVLYVTELPEYSEMEVTVIPDNKDADFSLYAYQIGLNNNSIVPYLSSCVSCEADYKWDRPKSGKTQDHTRTVGNFISLKNTYKIIIGVVGSNGLNSGSYTLKISMKSK